MLHFFQFKTQIESTIFNSNVKAKHFDGIKEKVILKTDPENNQHMNNIKVN